MARSALVRRVAIVVPLIALAIGSAEAHRYHFALTTMTCNERTGALEVIHRLFAHDLDVAMGGPGDDDAVARYVADRFSLSDARGENMPLNWVGSEINGDLVMTYQELPNADFRAVVRVYNALLFERFPGQVNQINVECGDSVRTMVFEQAGEREVDLGNHPR